MRNRPRANRRRGLLRAAAAIIILIILLIVVVLIASSLTAPTVKAPVVPATPGPIVRTPLVHPPTSTTPITRPTPHVTGTPGAKHKDVALASGQFDQRSGARAFADLMAAPSRSRVSAAVSPNLRLTAFFARSGPANSQVPLLIAQGRTIRRVGFGDPLLRPVWSHDGKHLLFVRVSETSGIPGARWQLLEFNLPSRTTRRLASVESLGVTPLGWSRGRILFLVAQPAALTVFGATPGKTSKIATLLSQPLIDASLSPNGRYIAVAAPANCGFCTLDIFDLDRGTLWGGPTGLPNASTIAWTNDGSTLVTEVGRRVAIVELPGFSVRYRPMGSTLPRRWVDVMRASVDGRAVTLTDTVTGEVYRSNGTVP
ncbi:MAG: hypothetical protein M3Z66_09705 [Chloroflexota bacterium]|nr:hypothetical protein [Chloroflexota bacterium]